MTRDSGKLIEWAPAIGLTGVPAFMVVLAVAAIPGHIGGKGSSRAADSAGSDREASMSSDVPPSSSEEAPRAASRRVATNAASPSRPRSRGFSPVRESEPVAEAVPAPTVESAQNFAPPQPEAHPAAFDQPPTSEPEDTRGPTAASHRAAALRARAAEVMPTPDAEPDAPAEAPAQPSE